MLRSRTSLPSAGKAKRNSLSLVIAVAGCVPLLFSASLTHAQAKDPGPRAGAASAGSFFPTLNADEQLLFNQAMGRFQEIDSVSGNIESGVGLGPTFNGNSCAMCHVQPALGGS